MKLDDITGRRFGRLVVLGRGPNGGKELRWVCRCDCGTVGLFFGQNIKRGLSSSCGCARAESASLRFTADLTGHRFGSLTALELDGHYRAPNGARHVLWKCVCVCGRFARVSAGDLRYGHTTTCGCRRRAHTMDVGHELYRLYDLDGRLLYVGITNDWKARSRRHAADKEWWSEVAWITRTPFPDRPSVMEAERAAIRSEDPVYNLARYEGVIA